LKATPIQLRTLFHGVNGHGHGNGEVTTRLGTTDEDPEPRDEREIIAKAGMRDLLHHLLAYKATMTKPWCCGRVPFGRILSFKHSHRFTIAIILVSMAHAEFYQKDLVGGRQFWQAASKILKSEKRDYWIPLLFTFTNLTMMGSDCDRLSQLHRSTLKPHAGFSSIRVVGESEDSLLGTRILRGVSCSSSTAGISRYASGIKIERAASRLN
jgi:hypothetical protein